MRTLTHVIAIILGISGPYAFTLWSTTDSGPRSRAHYERAAAMDARPVAVVGRFADIALTGKDPLAGAEAYFAPGLTEHGLPGDGASGAERLVERGWATDGQDRRILNTIANEEFAVLQQLVVPPEGEGRPHSEIDIFRVEDGRIVEHWEMVPTAAATAAMPAGDPVESEG